MIFARVTHANRDYTITGRTAQTRCRLLLPKAPLDIAKLMANHPLSLLAATLDRGGLAAQVEGRVATDPKFGRQVHVLLLLACDPPIV